MEVSYGEGVATHAGPESCAVGREAGGEALTGERAGRVSSREILDLCLLKSPSGLECLRGPDASVMQARPPAMPDSNRYT